MKKVIIINGSPRKNGNTVNAKLREKYDLHMKLERFIEDEGLPSTDKEFIRE